MENGKAVPTFLGQIKLFKGKVYKKSEKGEVPVSHGERFHKGDTLITKDQSFAKILMIDDTVISVGAKSEFKINDYEFTSKTERSFTYELLKGQIVGNVKNKVKSGALNFKTKFTTMGVRGTYIMMNARKLDNLDVAEYAILEGQVEVTDEKGGKVSIAKGERVNYIRDNDRAAEEKIQLTPDELKVYSAESMDEMKEFKPFLPYMNPDDIKPDSPLYSFFTIEKKDNPISDEMKTEKREDAKPHWSENLKKLNEKLKENQKKR